MQHDNPALVLVHGVHLAGSIWRPQVEQLRDTFAVHALDLPGCGTAPPPTTPATMDMLADSVLADIDALGLKRFVLVGHSLGGRVVQHALSRLERTAAMGRVAGVVLSHTSARGASVAEQSDRRAAARRYRDLAGGDPHKTLGVALDSAKIAEDLGGRQLATVNPRGSQLLRDCVAATRLESAAALQEAIGGRGDYHQLMRRVGGVVPVLVVTSMNDTAVAPGNSVQLHRNTPGSRLKVLQHDCHMANLYDPAGYSNLLATFATSLR